MKDELRIKKAVCCLRILPSSFILHPCPNWAGWAGLRYSRGGNGAFRRMRLTDEGRKALRSPYS
jgi:hypothetical protein